MKANVPPALMFFVFNDRSMHQFGGAVGRKNRKDDGNELIVIVAWFTAMPAVIVAVTWLMGFVPTHVGDWFVYLPMLLAQYLAAPGFFLGVVIMVMPIAAIIGLFSALWRHLFSKGG